MGSIEVGYISIGAIILLIGIARGYIKELGATIIILVAIFLLTFPEDQITAMSRAHRQGVLRSERPGAVSTVSWRPCSR